MPAILPLHLFSGAADELTNTPHLPLPFPLKIAFNAVYRIHVVMRWRSNAKEIFQNTKSTTLYLAGYGTNLLIGDRIVGLPLRVVAQITLISKCLIDSAAHYHRIHTAKQEMIDYALGRKVIIIKTTLHTKKRKYRIIGYFFDSYSIFLIKIKTKMLLTRIEKTVKAAFWTQIYIFQFSQSVIHLIEAHSLSIQNRNRAMNRIFLHMDRIMEDLVNNRSKLEFEILKHQSTIDRFLKFIHAPYNATHLQKHLQVACDVAEKATKSTSKVTNMAKNGVINIFKRLSEIFSFAFFNKTPLWCVPPEERFFTPPKVVEMKRMAHSLPFPKEPCGEETIASIQKKARAKLNRLNEEELRSPQKR